MSRKTPQSQPRKGQSNAKKPKKRDTPKKIQGTSGSKKKRTIPRITEDSRRTARAEPGRKIPKKGTPKNRILRSPRESKSQKAARLARNAKRRAAYRLEVGYKKTKRNKPRVKLAKDQRYWLKLQSTGKTDLRASYATKFIRSPRTKLDFKIRKKVKTVSAPNNVEALFKVQKGMSTFLKLGKKAKRTKSGKQKGKKTFIKLVLRDSQGNLRWISSKRKKFVSLASIKGRLAKMEDQIKGYGTDYEIVGYEAEENI